MLTFPEKSSGRIPREPDNKTGVGHALWLILGGKNANMREAAGRLKIDGGNLSSIIHGKQATSRSKLEGWYEILAEHYPQGWERHGATLKQRAVSLNYRGGHQPLEPDDKTGVGHALWLILGGKDANISEAARRLKVSLSYISNIIHDRVSIPRSRLEGWYDIIAEHYREGWERHGETFKQRATVLPHKKAPIDWKCAAAEFVKRVLAGEGDVIQDIIPGVSNHVLKKEEIWQRVTTGDPALPLTFYKAALTEICNLYYLEANQPSLYAKARRLMARLGR